MVRAHKAPSSCNKGSHLVQRQRRESQQPLLWSSCNRGAIIWLSDSQDVLDDIQSAGPPPPPLNIRWDSGTGKRHLD
jgi:hypothetical protein